MQFWVNAHTCSQPVSTSGKENLFISHANKSSERIWFLVYPCMVCPISWSGSKGRFLQIDMDKFLSQLLFCKNPRRLKRQHQIGKRDERKIKKTVTGDSVKPWQTQGGFELCFSRLGLVLWLCRQRGKALSLASLALAEIRPWCEEIPRRSCKEE